MNSLKKYIGILFAAVCMTGQFTFAEEENLQSTEIDFQQEVLPEVFEHTVSKVYSKNAPQPTQKASIRNSWSPYFLANSVAEPTPFPYFQMNLGFGLLRFSGVEGSIIREGLPVSTQRGVQGRIQYSRTPLFEALLGYQIFDFLQLAFSYQHQGDIDVQTNRQNPPNGPNAASAQTASQLFASLRLDAFAAKVYLNPPYVVVWKAISFNPYLGLGLGVSCQSWTNITIQTFNQVALLTGFSGNTLKNKYSGNAFFMVDTGLKLRSVMPIRNFSVSMGCKFNLWGQARNIGEINQQQRLSLGITRPFKVKTIYQFAPYMGVQWDF